MLYEYDLTVPANTPATAPVAVEAPVAPGRVSQVTVLFPTGCAGLVHAYITRSNHQVWPSNPDARINGNGEPVTWPDDYDLDDDPYAFICHAYNLDDTYPHTVVFRFAVIGGGQRRAAPETASLLDRLRQHIGV